MTVGLYWIPLGAGNRCVQINGRVFEALSATSSLGSIQLTGSPST
jgi:hypothetical protein